MDKLYFIFICEDCKDPICELGDFNYTSMLSETNDFKKCPQEKCGKDMRCVASFRNEVKS